MVPAIRTINTTIFLGLFTITVKLPSLLAAQPASNFDPASASSETTLDNRSCVATYNSVQMDQAKAYFSSIRSAKGHIDKSLSFYSQTSRSRYHSTSVCSHRGNESRTADFLSVFLSNRDLSSSVVKNCGIKNAGCVAISCIIEKSISSNASDQNLRNLSDAESREYALRLWNIYENFDSVIPLHESSFPPLSELRTFQLAPYPLYRLSDRTRPLRWVFKPSLENERAASRPGFEHRTKCGLADFSRNTIKLATSSSCNGYFASVLHEFGHFFDHDNDQLYKKSEFNKIINAKSERYWKMLLGSYSQSDKIETFAEAFMAASLPRNGLKYIAPNLTRYFDKFSRRVSYRDPESTRISISDKSADTLIAAQLQAILRSANNGQNPNLKCDLHTDRHYGRLNFCFEMPQYMGGGSTAFTTGAGIPFLFEIRPLDFSTKKIIPILKSKTEDLCRFGTTSAEQNRNLLHKLNDATFEKWSNLSFSIQGCFEEEKQQLRECVYRRTKRNGYEIKTGSSVQVALDQILAKIQNLPSN